MMISSYTLRVSDHLHHLIIPPLDIVNYSIYLLILHLLAQK